MNHPLHVPDATKTEISVWEGMGLVWDILLSVILLTMLFATGGVVLDRWLGTKFLFTIIGFIALVGVGYPIIKRKGQRIAKRLESHKKEQGT